VHAKDMRIDREQLYRWGVLSLGMGRQIPRLTGLGGIKWNQFISTLYAAGHDYVVSIEHTGPFRVTTAPLKAQELIKRSFLISRGALKPYVH
jgi:sugar phosphate isomerase/epimerase